MRGCIATLKSYFVDLRVITAVMCVWLAIVLAVLFELGIFSNPGFVAFGPRPELTFIHVPIDTYYKYNLLIVMIVLHTFVTDIISDSLGPHVLNVVQDPKTRHMPHRPRTYIAVTTVWALYCSITQLFGIFLAFAQIDLLAVRFLSDIVANFTTMNMYMHGKTCNPSMYHAMAAESAAAEAAHHTQDLDAGDSFSDAPSARAGGGRMGSSKELAKLLPEAPASAAMAAI